MHALATPIMRYVFIVLMCLMLLFAGVQYNDPDGLLWVVIYLLPALWCALIVFWQRAFERWQIRLCLMGSIAASAVGVLWFWPLTPQFWTREVWYNVETAREGMGLMIVASVLCLVLYQGKQRQGRTP